MAALTLRGISKSFGATPVLGDIDLDIADGEFLTLVGAVRLRQVDAASASSPGSSSRTRHRC